MYSKYKSNVEFSNENKIEDTIESQNFKWLQNFSRTSIKLCSKLLNKQNIFFRKKNLLMINDQLSVIYFFLDTSLPPTLPNKIKSSS